MVKSTEKWLRGEVTVLLDRPMVRRILIQRQMRSEFVVVDGVGTEDSTQVGLTEDDDVVEAFPADGDGMTIGAVSVSHQVVWCFIPRDVECPQS
jgi:hypothetical protein